MPFQHRFARLRHVIIFFGFVGSAGLIVTFQNCGQPFSAQIRQEAIASVCSTVKAPYNENKINDEVLTLQPDGSTSGPAKMIVTKDEPLYAMVDNKCLVDGAGSGFIQTVFEKDEALLRGLRYQAYAVELDRDYSAEELKKAVDGDKCVVGLNINRAIALHALPTDPLATTRQKTAFESMEASEAYDMLFGAGGITRQAVVGVIDSGIRYFDPLHQADLDANFIEIYETHPDLANVLWQADDGSVGSNLGTTQASFTNYPLDIGSLMFIPQQEILRVNHGTHVSGIIAASANNGVGIAGIANNAAKIMSIRVTSDKKMRSVGYDTGSASTIAKLLNGIAWAIEPSGKVNGGIADVINISMGTGPVLKANASKTMTNDFKAALQAALNKNIPVAVAAGNSSTDLTNFTVLPASLGEVMNGVITVGASSFVMSQAMAAQNPWLAPYSNYGATAVEIVAPGSAIVSTINESEDDPQLHNDAGNTRGYGELSGTSMASPQVAGAMALAVAYLKSKNIAYTAADIETLIVSSAKPRVSLRRGAAQPYTKADGFLNLKSLATALKAKATAPAALTGSTSRDALVKKVASETSFFECP